jgi:hypothetical protein
MRLIDVIKGTGTVFVNSSTVAVQYNLEVYEKEILGWIRPCCGKFGERLMLQMQDGTSARFCFTDITGAVDAVEIIR